MHRLAAAGIAVAGFAVPLLLRQARQDLLHIGPLVRVQPFGFGQLARIFQVAAADVVGGQGEPGTIRLDDALRQLLVNLDEVAGTAVDALFGVEAVGDTDRLGGALSEHHQAAHAGLGGRVGLPQRLLIAHGGEQAPVNLVGVAGLAEHFLVARQALLQVLGEGVSAYVAEHVDMAVVAFLQALQGAVGLGAFEKGVDLNQQAVILAGGYRPAHGVGVAQVEGDSHIGKVHLVHRQLVGVDQGQVDLPFIDHAQQVDHLDGVGYLELQLRLLQLECGQLFGMAAAGQHQNALADQICRLGWAALALAIDDLWRDFQIGNREARLALTLWCIDQAGGGHYRAVGEVEAGKQVVEVVRGFDLQFEPEIGGEALGQFVFETGGAVAVLEVGGGAVASDHAQLTLRLCLLEYAGLGVFATASKHQEGSNRQQPCGATHAYRRSCKHRRSIRKAQAVPYLDSASLLC